MIHQSSWWNAKAHSCHRMETIADPQNHSILTHKVNILFCKNYNDIVLYYAITLVLRISPSHWHACRFVYIASAFSIAFCCKLWFVEVPLTVSVHCLTTFCLLPRNELYHSASDITQQGFFTNVPILFGSKQSGCSWRSVNICFKSSKSGISIMSPEWGSCDDN